MDAGDAGRAPSEVVAELEADLDREATAWREQAEREGFRGLGDVW